MHYFFKSFFHSDTEAEIIGGVIAVLFLLVVFIVLFVLGYQLVRTGFVKNSVLTMFIGVVLMGVFFGVALIYILNSLEHKNSLKHKKIFPENKPLKTKSNDLDLAKSTTSDNLSERTKYVTDLLLSRNSRPKNKSKK